MNVWGPTTGDPLILADNGTLQVSDFEGVRKLTNGYIDQVPTGDVGVYEAELYRFFDVRYPAILKAIAEKKQIDDALKPELNAALKDFGQQFAARHDFIR